MKHNSKRLVLALFIAVLGTLAFIIFGIGPEEIDKFVVVLEKYTFFPFGIMIALGFIFHKIFPKKSLVHLVGTD